MATDPPFAATSGPVRAHRTLPPGVRRGYSLGSVATGAFGTVPGLLLLPYLTDRLGVSAGVAGLVVFIPKAWDVILNPIAGNISDRSTNPAGRRRPFLLRSGLALAVAFLVLFAGPTSPRGAATVWVVIAFLGCATAYAFFQVPYVAMPAELTDDYDERTRLMTWRVAVLALTILVSGGLSPLIRDALGQEWGYRGVGAFVAILILLGAVGAWWGTRKAPIGSAAAPAASFRAQLAIIAHARDYRLLLTTYALQAMAVGAMLAGVDYVARGVMRSSTLSSTLFVCFVAPALVVTPIWQAVGARRGKRSGFLLATCLLTLGACLTFGAARVSSVALALSVAMVGIAYAGTQMFPLAMLPDAAAVDAARTGENRAGIYTGVWTAAETLALACGPLVYALVLAIGGYRSSTDGLAQQPDSAITAISVGFSALPALLIGVSVVFLWRYRLDEVVGTQAHQSTKR